MDTKIAVYDNSITAREYLGYITEQAGGFACIGRDGKLYIKTIGQDTEELPLQYFQSYTWGEKFKISRIYYEDGTQIYEERDLSYEKGDKTGNTIYISQDNLYIVDEKQIENIYEQLNGLELYGFEGDSIINPALDVGDILLIDGKKVLYQGSCEYKGKMKASISSKIQGKEKEETMTRTPSQAAINRKIQSRINQAEGTIETLAQRQEKMDDELETNINQYSELKQAVDSISSTVAETTVTLDNMETRQTKLEQTSEGLEIAITSIENDGVEKVENTLVHINDTGINVSNNSEFSSQINEKGMYLKSQGKEIASYTKDGANIYNLKVTNEGQIGNLRILSVDVDNNTRTHIHWIGG